MKCNTSQEVYWLNPAQHVFTVRWQQAKDVNQDGNAALVTSTDNYGYSDKWNSDDATKLAGIPSLLNMQH